MSRVTLTLKGYKMEIKHHTWAGYWTRSYWLHCNNNFELHASRRSGVCGTGNVFFDSAVLVTLGDIILRLRLVLDARR